MFRALFLILVVMSSFAFAQTQQKPTAYKFFEYETINDKFLKEKLIEFCADVRKDGSRGYVINYGKDKEIRRRERKFQNFWTCGDIDAPSVRLVRGGDIGKSKTELWIVPPKADPPTP